MFQINIPEKLISTRTVLSFPEYTWNVRGNICTKDNSIAIASMEASFDDTYHFYYKVISYYFFRVLSLTEKCTNNTFAFIV